MRRRLSSAPFDSGKLILFLLYRSLQIVASLVPSVVLDGTPAGKAFWDCALAALSIKRDLGAFLFSLPLQHQVTYSL